MPANPLRPLRDRFVRNSAIALLAVVVLVVVLRLVIDSDSDLLVVLATLVLLTVLAHALRVEQQTRRTRARLARMHRMLGAVSKRAASSAERQKAAAKEDELRAISAVKLRDAVRVNHQQLTQLQLDLTDLRVGMVDRTKPGPLRYIVKESQHQYEQIQAAINLFAMVDITAPVPPLRGWAVSPDALNLLVEEFLSVRPSLVVECGSGSSTLFLALVARQYGIDTRIVALDHEAEYAAKTSRLLVAHGVDGIATARHAPLQDITTDRGPQSWYDPEALADLSDIGVLFVDGPPQALGEQARYPALPLLWDRLAPTTSVVLDDTDRHDEQAIIDEWMVSHPELTGEGYPTEKGTYILRRSTL